jgi:hypothetical protein
MRVQRKINWSGALIEQCGGFAISTRNAAGGACFVLTASLANSDKGTHETKNNGDKQRRRIG